MRNLSGFSGFSALMTFAVLATVVIGGCASLANLPPDVRAQIWLNEIDGWVGTIETLIARYDDSGESSEVYAEIVFAYDLLKPKILSTIKNVVLIQELTADQEAQLQVLGAKLEAVDGFIAAH